MALKDKVVLITGAGRGIGRAIALRFAGEGAKLALVARTTKEIKQLKDEITKSGGTAIAITADISSERQVANMVSKTETVFGSVDILINNAGTIVLRPLVDTSVEEWNQVMSTNLLGAFLCARTVMPTMMQRRTGRIINIGSMAGRRGYPDQGVYCTSKHGLVGLTKVLAIEGQQYGIRVNMVSPGGVLTGLSEELLGTRSASETSEWMTPEEVAEGVYYIAMQDGPATTDELVLRRSSSEPWR